MFLYCGSILTSGFCSSVSCDPTGPIRGFIRCPMRSWLPSANTIWNRTISATLVFGRTCWQCGPSTSDGVNRASKQHEKQSSRTPLPRTLTVFCALTWCHSSEWILPVLWLVCVQLDVFNHSSKREQMHVKYLRLRQSCFSADCKSQSAYQTRHWEGKSYMLDIQPANRRASTNTNYSWINAEHKRKKENSSMYVWYLSVSPHFPSWNISESSWLNS